MPTARDIITRALRDAGISGTGLNPSASLINDGLERLNDLLAQWSGQRWLVYHLIAKDLAMTGAVFYTVGPGGQFDFPISRPDRIEAGRIIQNNPPIPNEVGWPLKMIDSMEGYNNIRMQHLGSFPRYFFYDSAMPLGKVYFWPVPNSIYTGRLLVKDVLQHFADLNGNVDLPPIYYRALRFNLADELRMAYSLPPNPSLEKKATGAREVIKVANFQMPVLEMPDELVRRGNYNIFSDNTI